MDLLKVQGVRRSFGGLVALDQINFSVTKGQIKAIIGPNGAGKTTLFNVISGLLKPDAGSVHFCGKEITGLAPYKIARCGISRTFQNPSLFLHMNVIENIMVGRHRRSGSEFGSCALRWFGQIREERAILEAAMVQLERLGLSNMAYQSADSLAFGQRRMVELARALATEPELLLLDEPASGLNTKEKEDLGEFILSLKNSGHTILLVEHDMTMVMNLSDDILVLHYGAPIAEGPPSVVQNDPKVISVYLGDTELNAAAS